MALTEQELDYLEEFLLSSATPEDCMDIVTLDGFLTALAISPEDVDVVAWLPVVWGDVSEPVFESAEQATQIKTLICRRYDEIVAQFSEDPGGFRPTLYECEVDGKPAFSLVEWCSGFMHAIQHQGPLWQKFFDGDYHRLMVPFMLFGTQDDVDPFEDEEGDHTELLEKWLDTLVPSLAAIHAFWRDEPEAFDAEIDRSAPKKTSPAKIKETAATPDAKVGHADMPHECPCGSGDLFKNCCGSKSRLH